MLRRVLPILSGLLFVVPAFAQEKPKDDKPVVKKKATRESVIALRNRLQKASKDIKALADEPMPAGLTPEQQKKYQAYVKEELALAEAASATSLKLTKGLEDPKSNIDSMSEMGEMESLRLQMAMDRMSKMMSTLSNLLKKISDTANSITQNLK